MILRRSRHRKLAALVGAMAVLVAACGGATESVGGTAASGAEAPAEPEASTDGQPATSPADDEADEADEATADESAGEQAEATEQAPADEEEEAAAPAEPVQNLFPAVEVVDIQTSTPINLAEELGGGDLPVLLWFWAPH